MIILDLRVRRFVSLTAMAIVVGIFATPAYGQITLYSETFSASGGTQPDNAYIALGGPTIIAGEQSYVSSIWDAAQLPISGAPEFSLADPINVSFDITFNGPLVSGAVFAMGQINGAGTFDSFGVALNLDDISPRLDVNITNNGVLVTDSVSAIGLTPLTTYAVIATFAPGVTPGTTDVVYSMIAIGGPGGDIVIGANATLSEEIPAILATASNGGFEGDVADYTVDNFLVTGFAPPPPMPTTNNWGLGFLVVLVSLTGAVHARRRKNFSA